MFFILLSLITASIAQQGLDLVVTSLNCEVVASYTSSTKCFAKICTGSIVVSDDINFNRGDLVPIDDVVDFEFLPVNNCTFQADKQIFTYNSYGGIEDITIPLKGQVLIGFDSSNLYYRRENNVQIVSYLKNGMKQVATRQIGSYRITFGSWDAICTYDARHSNKCIFDGKNYDMGGMCAHKLYVVSGYAVMTCSKNFPPNIVRKVRIIKISDGTLIGEIGVPYTEGYFSSPEHDTLAVIKTRSGIQVQFAILGVGFLMEVLEQGTLISYRTTVNSFNSCSGTGTAFSNGGQIFVQSQQKLFMIKQQKTQNFDCSNIIEEYSFDQFKQGALCKDPKTFRQGIITKTETFDTVVNKQPNCVKQIKNTGLVEDIQENSVNLVKKKNEKQKGMEEMEQSGEGSEDGNKKEKNKDENKAKPLKLKEEQQEEEEVQKEIEVELSPFDKYNAKPNENDLNWAIMQEYPGLNYYDQDQEWYWYYRDKELDTSKREKDNDYWIDQRDLQYDLELCFKRGMNCTDTCCKQTYCAANPGECIYYERNDYFQLYSCVIVIIGIVVGIPACVKSMEFLLSYKFCKVYNDDENAYTGGTTMLEGCYTCVNPPKKIIDNGAESQVDVDDEYAKKDSGKAKLEPVEEKKESKVKTCCKACLCCITKNIVSVETEMAVNQYSEGQVSNDFSKGHVQFADQDLKNSIEGELQPNSLKNEDEETEQVADYYSDDY